MLHKISIDLVPVDNAYYVTDKDATSDELIKDAFLPAEELKELVDSLLDVPELLATRRATKLFEGTKIHIIQK